MKELKWADIKMKWYPPGTPLHKIPHNYAGHIYPNTSEGRRRAKEKLENLRLRSIWDFGAPAINSHVDWFNFKEVTSPNGVWVYGWWDEEPAQNELGEIAP